MFKINLRTIFKTTYIGFAIVILAGLASAQAPSGNVFFGYSFENTSSSALGLNLSRPNLQGWEGSLEGKWLPWVGIVADFSGHYGSESFTAATPNGLESVNVTGHELEVMFGPRVSIPVGKFTPFGEILVGVAHINTGGDLPNSSNTSFATAVGGGSHHVGTVVARTIRCGRGAGRGRPRKACRCYERRQGHAGGESSCEHGHPFRSGLE